jgi:hypothetical protein
MVFLANSNLSSSVIIKFLRKIEKDSDLNFISLVEVVLFVVFSHPNVFEKIRNQKKRFKFFSGIVKQYLDKVFQQALVGGIVAESSWYLGFEEITQYLLYRFPKCWKMVYKIATSLEGTRVGMSKHTLDVYNFC